MPQDVYTSLYGPDEYRRTVPSDAGDRVRRDNYSTSERFRHHREHGTIKPLTDSRVERLQFDKQGMSNQLREHAKRMMYLLRYNPSLCILPNNETTRNPGQSKNKMMKRRSFDGPDYLIKKYLDTHRYGLDRTWLAKVSFLTNRVFKSPEVFFRQELISQIELTRYLAAVMVITLDSVDPPDETVRRISDTLVVGDKPYIEYTKPEGNDPPLVPPGEWKRAHYESTHGIEYVPDSDQHIPVATMVNSRGDAWDLSFTMQDKTVAKLSWKRQNDKNGLFNRLSTSEDDFEGTVIRLYTPCRQILPDSTNIDGLPTQKYITAGDIAWDASTPIRLDGNQGDRVVYLTPAGRDVGVIQGYVERPNEGEPITYRTDENPDTFPTRMSPIPANVFRRAPDGNNADVRVEWGAGHTVNGSPAFMHADKLDTNPVGYTAPYKRLKDAHNKTKNGSLTPTNTTDADWAIGWEYIHSDLGKQVQHRLFCNFVRELGLKKLFTMTNPPRSLVRAGARIMAKFTSTKQYKYNEQILLDQRFGYESSFIGTYSRHPTGRDDNFEREPTDTLMHEVIRDIASNTSRELVPNTFWWRQFMGQLLASDMDIVNSHFTYVHPVFYKILDNRKAVVQERDDGDEVSFDEHIRDAKLIHRQVARRSKERFDHDRLNGYTTPVLSAKSWIREVIMDAFTWSKSYVEEPISIRNVHLAPAYNVKIARIQRAHTLAFNPTFRPTDYWDGKNKQRDYLLPPLKVFRDRPITHQYKNALSNPILGGFSTCHYDLDSETAKLYIHRSLFTSFDKGRIMRYLRRAFACAAKHPNTYQINHNSLQYVDESDLLDYWNHRPSKEIDHV